MPEPEEYSLAWYEARKLIDEHEPEPVAFIRDASGQVFTIDGSDPNVWHEVKPALLHVYDVQGRHVASIDQRPPWHEGRPEVRDWRRRIMGVCRA